MYFLSSSTPEPIFCQILPRRVHADDQLDLLDPSPAFQLLFAGNRILYPLESLPIHESVYLVAAGEAFKDPGLVLKDAQSELAGNADVKCPRSIGHDVDVKPLLCPIDRSFDSPSLRCAQSGIAQDDKILDFTFCGAITYALRSG